jgi:hypothetical protein
VKRRAKVRKRNRVFIAFSLSSRLEVLRGNSVQPPRRQRFLEENVLPDIHGPSVALGPCPYSETSDMIHSSTTGANE